MKILKSFEYLETGTVEETVRILLGYGGKAKVLAGGVYHLYGYWPHFLRYGLADRGGGYWCLRCLHSGCFLWETELGYGEEIC